MLRVSDREDLRRSSFSFMVGFNTEKTSFHLVSPPNLSTEGRWSNIHCAHVSFEINLGWSSKLGVVSVGLLRAVRLWPLVPREGVALLTQAFGKQMMNEMGLNVKDELHRIRMGFDFDFKVGSKACPFRHFFQGRMEIVHWYSCIVYSLIGQMILFEVFISGLWKELLIACAVGVFMSRFLYDFMIYRKDLNLEAVIENLRMRVEELDVSSQKEAKRKWWGSFLNHTESKESLLLRKRYSILGSYGSIAAEDGVEGWCFQSCCDFIDYLWNGLHEFTMKLYEMGPSDPR
ncbi:hypothetical protein V6N12_070336 [Hibiscus sabdariffa]|uniref:Copper transporter n=1 Tax=Hibiscus sabdariffa TaxID=183260 RepID=A0ABR2FGI3_9ROSI